MSGYIVVFQDNDKAGNYGGIITWSNYRDKAHFDTHREKLAQHYNFIAEGVSDEEAMRHVHNTPARSRLLVALHEATEPDGSVNTEKLRMTLSLAVFAIELDAEKRRST